MASLLLVLFWGVEFCVPAGLQVEDDETDDHRKKPIAAGLLSVPRPFGLDVFGLWPLDYVYEDLWAADSDYLLRLRDDDVSNFVNFYAEEAWELLGGYDRELVAEGKREACEHAVAKEKRKAKEEKTLKHPKKGEES
jgi:hypothetical protein